MATEEDDSCSWYDVSCHAGEFVGNVADTALADFIESIHSAAVHVMDLVGTWWMSVDGPDFESDAVSSLQENLQYFVWVFGVLGFFIALGKLAVTQDPRSSAMSIGGQIFRIILAGGVYMTAIPLLLEAGDSTSTWLLEQAHGDNAEAGFSGLLGSSAALMSLSGAAFVIYLLLFIGAIVNFVFMLFRNVMFLVLIVFIVVLAAGSSTEAGQQAWRKANGWLLALLLFKPIAAAIYALGFRLLRENSATEGADEIMDGLVSSLTGLLILALASLALPALVKFVVPAAAAGAGAFSGGAALGAAAGVAAGAAVVAATGGAGAAAAGGSGAATGGAGAASAGGSGAATGGAGAASGGGSGAATAEGAGTGAASSGGGDSPTASGSNDDGDSPSPGGGDSPTASGSNDDGDSPSSGGGSGAATAEGAGTGAASSGGGDSPTASGSNDGGDSPSPGATPTADGSSGNGRPNLKGAYQAYETASGAMTPSNTNDEDET